MKLGVNLEALLYLISLSLLYFVFCMDYPPRELHKVVTN